MTVKRLRIGTRGSPLALKQTEMVRAALTRTHPDLETEIVVIKTSGDWVPADGETRLNEQEGGKGLFAKEIEAALLAGEIDAAVHSMKDMDSVFPEGLGIQHMLPRADARDALITASKAGPINKLEDLPEGAVIGTSSVRRQAFLLNKRPDLKIVPIRGNVGTRLEKLRAGQVDATLLAIAGLERMGLAQEAGVILAEEDMLPAAGQGAVGIEIANDSTDIIAIFDQISDRKTTICVFAERAALAVLDGSCHTPIGAYAQFENDHIDLRLCVASLDGRDIYRRRDTRPARTVEEAVELGTELGTALKTEVPEHLLDQRAA